MLKASWCGCADGDEDCEAAALRAAQQAARARARSEEDEDEPVSRWRQARLDGDEGGVAEEDEDAAAAEGDEDEGAGGGDGGEAAAEEEEAVEEEEPEDGLYSIGHIAEEQEDGALDDIRVCDPQKFRQDTLKLSACTCRLPPDATVSRPPLPGERWPCLATASPD